MTICCRHWSKQKSQHDASCQIWSLTWILSSSPCDSIRLAMLTVLPQMSNCGFPAPTTPATTGPDFKNQNYFYSSVSILYLNQIFYFILSSSLRDRDRADTKITFHHPPTTNFLRTLELTYTQVWYIIGIFSSSPSDFCTKNIDLCVVTIHLFCQQ